MIRTHRAALPLSLSLVFAATLAIAGEAKTPLGRWMKPNIGIPLAGQDFATLQTSLKLVASKPPPSGDYAQWASIANGGADAAGKQDLAGVKASCKQCHDAYKQKYVNDFPTRAFP